MYSLIFTRLLYICVCVSTMRGKAEELIKVWMIKRNTFQDHPVDTVAQLVEQLCLLYFYFHNSKKIFFLLCSYMLHMLRMVGRSNFDSGLHYLIFDSGT